MSIPAVLTPTQCRWSFSTPKPLNRFSLNFACLIRLTPYAKYGGRREEGWAGGYLAHISTALSNQTEFCSSKHTYVESGTSFGLLSHGYVRHCTIKHASTHHFSRQKNQKKICDADTPALSSNSPCTSHQLQSPQKEPHKGDATSTFCDGMTR